MTGLLLSLELVLLLGSAAAWAQKPPGGMYSCVDAAGRKRTSDRPIPECTDREQKLLSANGMVKGTMGPAQSPQEQAAQEEARKKAADERLRKDEVRRQEQVLFTRFPNQAAHDRARQEALGQVEAERQTALKHVAELKHQLNALGLEMEFYKKDPSRAPASLRQKVEENTRNQEMQVKLMAKQDADVKRIHGRFDQEKNRLSKWWNPTAPNPGTAAAPTPMAVGNTGKSY